MSPALRNLPRRVVHAIVNWSVAQRWLVLLACVLLTGYALRYTASNISIDTGTSQMSDVRLPHRQANLALTAAFPHLPGDVVVFAESSHAGAAEDAADALAARLAARSDIAQVVSQPGGGEFFRRNGLLYLSTDELWRIDERLAEATPLLGTLAHDPSLRGLFGTLTSALDQPLDDARQALLARMFSRLAAALAADDGASVHWRDELFETGQGLQRAFVLIDPARENTSFQPEQAALDKLHLLLAEMAQDWPDVQFQVTGSAPMNSEELVTVADDTGLTTLLSFAAVALVLVAIYTLRRRELGLRHAPRLSGRRETLAGAALGAGIGFYDGIFGPGTGSFLVFALVRGFGYDFLHASATAKLINVATNIAALALFAGTGQVFWQTAGVMAVCNVAGSVVGSRAALRGGAVFVRRLFLLVMSALIAKMAWDLLAPAG